MKKNFTTIFIYTYESKYFVYSNTFFFLIFIFLIFKFTKKNKNEKDIYKSLIE